jgi:hypothetical protein
MRRTKHAFVGDFSPHAPCGPVVLYIGHMAQTIRIYGKDS